MPLPLKPLPEVVSCEIVRLAFPVLLTEIACVPLIPTMTLPKFTLAGLALSCATGAATPEPLSVTEVGLFDALLTNEICPEALPVVVGENCAE
jgi:hypothetical protein